MIVIINLTKYFKVNMEQKCMLPFHFIQEYGCSMVQCSVLPLKFHFCAQCCIDISLPYDESGISLFINTSC